MIKLTSMQVLLILQHDHMPAYLFGMVGRATRMGELCCVWSRAKLYINDQMQYSLHGYAYDQRDERCYNKVIHPWLPKSQHHAAGHRNRNWYYADYARREVRGHS